MLHGLVRLKILNFLFAFNQIIFFTHKIIIEKNLCLALRRSISNLKKRSSTIARQLLLLAISVRLYYFKIHSSAFENLPYSCQAD